MAEYYAVLSRAVASLEVNTPEARRAVYDKARNALIAQLKAIVPPLPTSEISRQRLELEEAIRRAEREATSGGAAAQRAAPRRPSPSTVMPPAQAPVAPPPAPPAPPPQAAQAPVPPIPAPPPVQAPPPRAAYAQPAPREAPPPPAPPLVEAIPPTPVAASSPQEVFRRAIREAETRTDIPEPSIERAPMREEAFGDMGAQFHVADHPRGPADQGGYTPRDYRTPRRTEPEPRLAPDYAWEAEAPQPEPVIPRHAPTPQLDGDDRPVRVKDGRRRGKRGRGRDGDFEPTIRQSRLPVILLLVLIVAMVSGLAALAWWQRGELSRLFADSGTTSQPVASAPQAAPPPPAPPADTAAAGKNSDRLLGGNAVATTPDVRVVGDAGNSSDTGAATGDTAAAPGDTAAQSAAPAPADVATAAPPPTQAEQPAAQGGDTALVAQKAVLYEEPLDSTKAATGVTQINAAVTWSFVDDPSNGPSVVANVDVPQRGLSLRVLIHKNADKTLPASHLIEVSVQTSAAFPGKSISSIPRLVLKPSEDARGQPLIGATAKVSDGLFWIALSALPADIQSNLSLLKDRDWIDLPLVYETGQRAILTFEKGTPGDRVLAQAMSAWGEG